MASNPAVLAALGLAVGFFGSLVGIGGGFLMVPYFTLLIGWAPPLAVGTSLGVVTMNAAGSAAGYLQQKRIDLALGLTLGLATLPGAVAGRWISERIDAGSFRIAFAVMVAAAALLLLSVRREEAAGIAWFRRGRMRRLVDGEGRAFEYSLNLPAMALLSVLFGTFGALFGVGGGFLYVPAMILLAGIPTHVAMATAQVVVFVSSAAGFAMYASWDHADWRAVLTMAPAAVVGAQIGSRVALRTGSVALRRVLALILVGAAAAMLLGRP